MAAAAGVVLTQAVRSGGDTETQLPAIEPREPISQVEAPLLADDWVAKPDRDPLSFEQQLANNTLARSLGAHDRGWDCVAKVESAMANGLQTTSTGARHKHG